MSGFVKSRPLTEEEQEIDAALDRHTEARSDEGKVVSLIFAGYLIGLPLDIIGSDNSIPDRVGMTLITVAIILVPLYAALAWRTAKRGRAAKALLDPYFRKKAQPFFEELTEVLADKPGIHLRLTDDGTIVVTDKRKQEEK